MECLSDRDEVEGEGREGKRLGRGPAVPDVHVGSRLREHRGRWVDPDDRVRHRCPGLRRVAGSTPDIQDAGERPHDPRERTELRAGDIVDLRSSARIAVSVDPGRERIGHHHLGTTPGAIRSEDHGWAAPRSCNRHRSHRPLATWRVHRPVPRASSKIMPLRHIAQCTLANSVGDGRDPVV